MGEFKQRFIDTAYSKFGIKAIESINFEQAFAILDEIMRYTFEEEFRLDHPETVGETDREFDLNNYKDWLEAQLIEARKQLALYSVVGRSEQLVCDCGKTYNERDLEHGMCHKCWEPTKDPLCPYFPRSPPGK